MLLILVALGCAIFYAQGHDQRAAERAAQNRPALPRNIYIITAGGLRPDHLTSFQYEHNQTPELDFLAYDGVRFKQAYTPSPESDAAHLSLLTGMYTFRQPIKGWLDYADFESTEYSQLSGMPEWLNGRGYRTAAFLSDPGLCGAPFRALFGESRIGNWSGFPWESGFTSSRLAYLARTWILQHKNEPQFALINFNEPSLPFRPPPPYGEQYKNHPYDGEIAALDEQIGLLIHTLKKSGLFERSIIVFASAYGESLDSEIHTGSVEEHATQVTLFIAAPGLLPRNETYETPVSLIDVFPSILKVIDAPLPKNLDGVSLFEKGSRSEKQRDLYGETRVSALFGGSPHYYKRGSDDDYWTGNEAVQAIATLPGFVPAKGPSLLGEVLPDELLESVMDHAKKGKLDSALAALDAAKQLPQTPYRLALSGQLSEALLNFDRASKDYQAAYRISTNPELARMMARVNIALGDVDQARQWAGVYASRTKALSYDYYRTMGVIDEQSGSLAQGAEDLSKAIHLNPDDSRAYQILGTILQQQTKPREAALNFQKAIEADPQNVSAMTSLAQLLMNSSRKTDAIPYYRKIFKLNPADEASALVLAQLLYDSGQSAEASKICKQIILETQDPKIKEEAKRLFAR